MKNKLGRREGEVWDACDELLGEEKKITLDTIQDKLEELGFDRGSPNYIYKYRKTWLDHKGMTMDELKALAFEHEREALRRESNQDELPKPLLKRFELFVREIKEGLKREYSEKLDSLSHENDSLKSAIKSLDVEKQAIELGREKLDAQVQQLESEAHGLADTAEQLKQENALLERDVISGGNLLAEVKDNYERQLEQAYEQHQAGILKHEALLSESRANHNKEREQWAASQESMREQHMLQVDALKTENMKLSQQLDKITIESRRVSQRLDEAVQLQSRQQTQIKHMSDELTECKQEIHSHEINQASKEAQIAGLETQLKEIKIAYENISQKLLKEREQSVILNKTLDKLLEEKQKVAGKELS